MDLDKALKKRASVRKYMEKRPKDDKIIDAIEAASLAPTAGNIPSIKYIVVEDEEMIDQIAEACQQQFIKKAPVIVVVCTHPEKTKTMYDERAEMYLRQQAGAAIENFLLKVADMKLASCWIGAFSDVTIKDLLDIPEEVKVEAILPVAYQSKADKSAQRRKPALGRITYFHKWGNKYQKRVWRIGTH